MCMKPVELGLPAFAAETDDGAACRTDGIFSQRGAVAQTPLVDVDDLGSSAGKANPEALVVFAGA